MSWRFQRVSSFDPLVLDLALLQDSSWPQHVIEMFQAACRRLRGRKSPGTEPQVLGENTKAIILIQTTLTTTTTTPKNCLDVALELSLARCELIRSISSTHPLRSTSFWLPIVTYLCRYSFQKAIFLQTTTVFCVLFYKFYVNKLVFQVFSIFIFGLKPWSWIQSFTL